MFENQVKDSRAAASCSATLLPLQITFQLCRWLRLVAAPGFFVSALVAAFGAPRPNVGLMLSGDHGWADARLDKVKELRARYDRFARQVVRPKNEPKPPDGVTPRIWGEPK